MILLSVITAKGQEILWAQKNNLDKKTDFTKVLGQNKHGIYVLKHKNSTFRKYFIVELFDRRMNLLRAKTIKIPNAELQKIIVLKDRVVFFTKTYEKGFTNGLTMQTLDTALVPDVPKNLLTGKVLSNDFPDFRIDYNNERDKFMIWYLTRSEKGTDINLQLMEQLSITASRKISVEYQPSEMNLEKTVISPKGHFYCMMSISKNFKSHKAADFTNLIMGIDMQSGEMNEKTLTGPDTFLASGDMVYHPLTNTLHVTGYYGIKEDDENKGYFDITFKNPQLDEGYRIFETIDRKFVAGIIGLKFEQKGENLSKFRVRKIIPKNDGGVVLISERTFITTQSDIFYVNGIQQTNYARIFNNDEVILTSLDSNGKVIWNEVAFKNQSSVNDGGYYNGIVIMVNDDNISLIYNDRLSANADVIQISYREDGSHHKKILLNSDQYYALVIPAEYNQVTANSTVLPISQSRDFTYIKLVY